MKLVYSFPSPQLIQGIWWSTRVPLGDHEGYLRGIKKVEFSVPDSMGGHSYEITSIENKKKDHDLSQSDGDILFFNQPILTESISLSEFAFTTNIKEMNDPKDLRFSLEFYGCSDYQPDISMALRY